jgi:hypothetical protein
MDRDDKSGSGGLAHHEIAARAHQLWFQEGCPSGCAERHWLLAERELHTAANSRNLIEKVNEKAGSVQA